MSFTNKQFVLLFSLFISIQALIGCSGGGSGGRNYDHHIKYIQNSDPYGAPYLNPHTADRMMASNSYDLIGDHTPISEEEKFRVMKTWKASNTDITWHEYYGNFVRVEVLRNNRDLKTMRLRYFHGQETDTNIEGNINSAIEKTANKIVKMKCGKKAKDAIIVSKKPSFDILRPTPFYDYVVVAKAPAVQEYAFRCIY